MIFNKLVSEADRQDKPRNAKRARAELSILDAVSQPSAGLERVEEPAKNLLSRFFNASV